MSKIFCFGELLLRMNPALNGAWIKDGSMPVYIGGSELNVAHALANWQMDVRYGTALPDNYLAHEIIDYLDGNKIDTSAIRISGERIGLYFLPEGTDLQAKGVIYDRTDSAFANLTPGVIDWEVVLKDCDWFHFSAISPALNKNIAAICREAIFYATQKKMTISVDLNYRSALWESEKEPIRRLPELVQYCHVIMGNIWSADSLLGIGVDPDIHKEGNSAAYIKHAARTAMAIRKKFPVCMTVANTFRFEGGRKYFATMENDEGRFVSPEFSAEAIIDPVGSGDCFMAGLIYGLNKKHASQDIINYAAAAAFGKLQEKGDATSQTIASVLQKVKEYE